ncbi:MAG: hypothetical protein ABII76_25330 [Pseudomonadota bacterium]
MKEGHPKYHPNFIRRRMAEHREGATLYAIGKRHQIPIKTLSEWKADPRYGENGPEIVFAAADVERKEEHLRLQADLVAARELDKSRCAEIAELTAERDELKQRLEAPDKDLLVDALTALVTILKAIQREAK